MLSGNDYVEKYLSWLRENITTDKIGQYTQITTPFVDNYNDFIQIYIKQDGNILFMTDDGNTLNNLAMSGCDINSPKRKAMLNTLILGAGATLLNDEITVQANTDNFAQKKHSLIQAILSVSDMFMLSGMNVKGLFLEDVSRFLQINDIRFTAAIQFTGRSGLSYNLDFVIPSSQKMPERIIKTINQPTKERSQATMFAWNDIKEVRSANTRMYVILNDTEKKIKNEIITAFDVCGIIPVLWSKKEEHVQELSA